MKVKRLLIPLIAIVALLGSVVVGNVFGWWQVVGTPLTLQPDASVEDIKGSSSLEQVSIAFTIPQADLYRILGLPDNIPFATQLKDLESYNEVTAVRTKIAEYLQGRSTPEGTTDPAATPTNKANTSPTAKPTPASNLKSATVTPEAGQVSPACEIKGTLTLQQVSDQCAIPLDVLYQELKLPSDMLPSTVLKDIQNTVSGFEITLLRDVVAAYQAR